MKVVIASEQKPEEHIELRLTTDSDGIVAVQDQNDYYVVGFKVVDGKVSLARYSSLPDDKYNVEEDNNGFRIAETEE